MSSNNIDWIEIKQYGKPIGAVGFIGSKAVLTASYFDYRDNNQDGKVSTTERVVGSLPFADNQNRAMTLVASEASVNLDVIARDASYGAYAKKLWLGYAAELHKEGIYQVYLARGAKMAGANIARFVVAGKIKQFIVRKGFEKVVKDAFEASLGVK